MSAAKDLLWRRFENLKKLNLLGDLNITEEALREEIEEADEHSLLEYLDDRYLVVMKSSYQGQDDERRTENCASLEEVEAEILDWTMTEAGLDYSFFAYVYDLDEGVEVHYLIKTEVEWLNEKR